jgi:S-formylglutathione hydrolase FrmB
MAFVDWHYFSTALGKQTSAYVILPEVGTGPYPVLYLLHGMSDDHTIWLRRTSIERYVATLPLIVVMPNGERSFYCDAVEGYPFGTAIGVELVDRVDRTFPTHAERSGRATAGLSMGGYGALRLALTYPERFCAAVSHSGALGFGHRKVGHDGKPLSPEYLRILGENPMGGQNDLHALVTTIPPDKLPALRIDCGTEDFLLDANREYHSHLKAEGIPHEYEEHPGAHNWDYWDIHIQDTLKFLTDKLSLN